MICDPQIDGSFLTVEKGLRVEQFQRGPDGLCAWAVARLPLIGLTQKELEQTRADGMILPVAIDLSKSNETLILTFQRRAIVRIL